MSPLLMTESVVTMKDDSVPRSFFLAYLTLNAKKLRTLQNQLPPNTSDDTHKGINNRLNIYTTEYTTHEINFDLTKRIKPRSTVPSNNLENRWNSLPGPTKQNRNNRETSDFHRTYHDLSSTLNLAFLSSRGR